MRCGKTWTPRARRRGRKRLRARINLACTVLRAKSSLRGLAELRYENRETLRTRFQRSLSLWARIHPLLPVPAGDLIAIVDTLWFKTRHHRPAFGCFAILLRPVHSEQAHLATLVLLKGRESVAKWHTAFQSLPGESFTRIKAIVADGFTGLITYAHSHKWHFQLCQVHMRRRMMELRGFRALPGRTIRRLVMHTLIEFMETSDEHSAQAAHERLVKLFRHPHCPQTIITRLSGAVKRGHLLRTCFAVPELHIPTSTNSVERVNAFIRERFELMRGVNSNAALYQWLGILQRQIKTIRARGYRATFARRIQKQFYRKNMS